MNEISIDSLKVRTPIENVTIVNQSIFGSKFIVDGEWLVDPNNTVKEYDGEGHVNSVVMVK